jgi:hypothetical protein
MVIVMDTEGPFMGTTVFMVVGEAVPTGRTPLPDMVPAVVAAVSVVVLHAYMRVGVRHVDITSFLFSPIFFQRPGVMEKHPDVFRLQHPLECSSLEQV